MLDALAEYFPPQAEWTGPGAAACSWVTLPDFIDTTDLLARALRENVAFVPGEAPYLSTAAAAIAMRLNFSGSGEDEIREGIRRIGEVVKEQVALYGTLTGEDQAPRRRPAPLRRRRPRSRATRARASCRCAAAAPADDQTHRAVSHASRC